MSNRDEHLRIDKRSSQRAPVPKGTMALLKTDRTSLESFYVRDISGAGILISNSYTKEMYPVDSLIKDIFIIIPSNNPVNDWQGNTSKHCFLINQAKVVRSCFDQDSLVTTYGISFLEINTFSQQDLTALLDVIPDPIPSFADNIATST